VCAVVLPNSLHGGKGSCGYYEWRPLVCRLFGYAVQRNKWEAAELCTCRIIREKEPSSVRRAEIAIREGLGLPVYQEAFMQIASLDPATGYRMLSINRAIKEALEHIYWTRPRGKGWRPRGIDNRKGYLVGRNNLIKKGLRLPMNSEVQIKVYMMS